MNHSARHHLQTLAEAIAQSPGDEQHTLAAGVLELLCYRDELAEALDGATHACCEALFLTYEYTPDTRTEPLHEPDAWSTLAAA